MRCRAAGSEPGSWPLLVTRSSLRASSRVGQSGVGTGTEALPGQRAAIVPAPPPGAVWPEQQVQPVRIDRLERLRRRTALGRERWVLRMVAMHGRPGAVWDLWPVALACRPLAALAARTWYRPSVLQSGGRSSRTRISVAWNARPRCWSAGPIPAGRSGTGLRFVSAPAARQAEHGLARVFHEQRSTTATSHNTAKLATMWYSVRPMRGPRSTARATARNCASDPGRAG